MKDFIQRYLVLTKEERRLLAGIILILLCGIAARYVMMKREANAPPPVESPGTAPRQTKN